MKLENRLEKKRRDAALRAEDAFGKFFLPLPLS